jgi:hypothetical protein
VHVLLLEDWDKASHFELYTFVVVLVLLVGYIIQFIGLRGMKAWVSLTQLGITIVRSMLRASLRMQRLHRKGNKLLDKPNKATCQDLDWLAFEIREYHDGSFRQIGSHMGKDVNTIDSHDPPPEGVHKPNPTNTPRANHAGRDQVKFKDLIRARVRLAHMTGHVPLGKLKDRE